MTYRYCFIAAILFVSCGGAEEEETTGSIMEFEHVDPSYEMDDQPEIIQHFFLLDPEFIGEDFCYDHEVVQSVLLADQIETSDMPSWDLFSLSNKNNYIGLESSECQVTLEFKTFKEGKKRFAFLNQVNRGNQRFDYLELNPKTNEWMNAGILPRPTLVEFFDDLTEEESELVDQNGVQFIFLSETSDTLHYYFSVWEMAQRVDVEEAGFNKEPDAHFIMLYRDGEFVLEKVYTDSE